MKKLTIAGPPGSGKTPLANRILAAVPPQAVEVTEAQWRQAGDLANDGTTLAVASADINVLLTSGRIYLISRYAIGRVFDRSQEDEALRAICELLAMPDNAPKL